MNFGRLLKLKETIEWLRDTPELPTGLTFNLAHWCVTDPCGTAMCLGGWYVHRNPGCGLVFDCELILEAGQLRPESRAGVSVDVLSRHFGIDSAATVRLFFPTTYPWTRRHTREFILPLALARLQRLMREGDIPDWFIVEQRDAASRGSVQ